MNSEHIQRLRAIVGESYVTQGDDIAERFRVDVGRRYTCQPLALVRPESTAQVSEVVKVAAQLNVVVTVVGGQTGTVGGAIARDGDIAMSLDRMSRVLEIDTLSMTMTVEAGCILQLAQEAAEAEQAFLPLDLGARGTAQIGGSIGANAGGNRVVRWGMMRDMVLGLEVVLADGTVVSGLTKMLKDNAGYNWKHLLIGSEGTLGIITRAVLRLRPLPTTRQTALFAMGSFEQAIAVLRRLEMALGGQLSSFELMWQDFYRTMTEAQQNFRSPPLSDQYPIYALVEAMGNDAQGDVERMEQAVATLLDEELVSDGVFARSSGQADALWAVREDLQWGLQGLRPFAAYDVSMAIADMPKFVADARARLEASLPGAVALFYGHAGDGNLHALVSVGELGPSIEHKMDEAIYGATRSVNGSVSAEHGIGMKRRAYLSYSRSEPELALMRQLKLALDPHGRLNPGKILG